MSKIIKISIITSVILLVGCQSVNSRLGRDSSDYVSATELPMLKMPPDSLALSKRYEIPHIPDSNKQILTNDMPPDYY